MTLAAAGIALGADAGGPARDRTARLTLACIVFGVLPSLWGAWLLWLAPIDGLTADRTALAARDFTALWTAGHAAAERTLLVLSTPATFTAYLRSLFGDGIPNQIWPYPPPTLLLARPFAALPLGPGFVAYSVASVAALAAALWAGGLPQLKRLAILVSPAVLTNALTGQNGAVIAALLVGGLLLVDRRPVIAGLLLGALVIKPQFMLLLPICLIAGARWRTAIMSCMTSIALALSSLILFGYKPWVEFLSGSGKAVSAYIGATWQADPAQSIFSSTFIAARSMGAGVDAAYLLQGLVSAGCAYGVWRLWRRPDLPAEDLSTEDRAVATIPLVLLASPWVHTYDMPALAVSVACLLTVRFGPRRILLGIAWLWPGLSPMIAVPPVVAVLSLVSVAWLAAARPRPERDASLSS